MIAENEVDGNMKHVARQLDGNGMRMRCKSEADVIEVRG